MQEQRFGDAERCIGQARTQLRDLGQLQVQVSARREHLNKLAQVLPQETSNLQLEAQSLVEYIQENIDDLSSDQLSSASDLHAEAENLVTATGQNKPDYLALETSLATLSHQISSLFTEVRERVSELKRLRDRARSLEGSVQSSYSRSNSYISSHSSKVDYTARSRHESAKRQWGSRGNYDPHDTASLITYIALLEALDNDFDSSYRSAMSDVSSWESSHSSSSSSWSSSGSGGGSDWGSGGFDSGSGGGSNW
jgi:chromosome segregation ATPase